MSLPEVLLWNVLRRRTTGLRFRRQHPIGPYVLDFYCAAIGLAVEVDGDGHNMGDRPARDIQRDAWLATQGVRIVRVPAVEVLRDVEAAVATVLAAAPAPFVGFADTSPKGEDLAQPESVAFTRLRWRRASRQRDRH
jgi:very-short-patch-repair endonuclease